jgi:hypothetical protein
MACSGQSGADRFDAGEIEDRRAARAAPVCDRDRDPALAPGPDGLGGVLRKRGHSPILGEPPTKVCGLLIINLQSNVDIACTRRSPCALRAHRYLGVRVPAAHHQHRRSPSGGWSDGAEFGDQKRREVNRRCRFADGPSVGRRLRGSDRWGFGRHRCRRHRSRRPHMHAIETFLLGIAGLLQTIELGSIDTQGFIADRVRNARQRKALFEPAEGLGVGLRVCSTGGQAGQKHRCEPSHCCALFFSATLRSSQSCAGLKRASPGAEAETSISFHFGSKPGERSRSIRANRFSTKRATLR